MNDQTFLAPSESFWDMVKGSFGFAFKNIHRYLLLTILFSIPFLIIGGLLFFGLKVAFGQGAFDGSLPNIDPSVLRMPLSPLNVGSLYKILGGFSALFILIVPLAILYGLWIQLAFVRLTTNLKSGQPEGYGALLKWSLHRLLSYLMLQLRIFIYVGGWLFLIILLLYAGVGFMAGAQIGPSQLFSILNFILGIAGLASVFFVIYRVPKTLFSPFVFAQENLSSSDALKQSVEVVTGHWWKTVLYVLGAGILFAILTGILSAISFQLNVTLGLVIQSVLSFVMTFYILSFQYQLYQTLKASSSPNLLS